MLILLRQQVDQVVHIQFLFDDAHILGLGELDYSTEDILVSEVILDGRPVFEGSGK